MGIGIVPSVSSIDSHDIQRRQRIAPSKMLSKTATSVRIMIKLTPIISTKLPVYPWQCLAIDTWGSEKLSTPLLLSTSIQSGQRRNLSTMWPRIEWFRSYVAQGNFAEIKKISQNYASLTVFSTFPRPSSHENQARGVSDSFPQLHFDI